MSRRTAILLLPLVLALGACGGTVELDHRDVASTTGASPAPAGTVVERKPLAGRVVVLDPGHQLGNRNFPGRINRLVPDGRGGRKTCNTTGTATAGGYPEATVVWQVARLARQRLERRGATVRLTRATNSDRRWGPCVDVRGRAGNRPRADLKLSIHADGSLARGARGFHVIVAPDAASGSGRLARVVRSDLRRGGFRVANYIAGGDGLDVRTDLATLNFARVPTAMVELGNMRDRVDAGRLTSPRGRTAYAAALARAVGRYLER
ncbi:N-acetylmuramoyl-L-alanine amidase [Nocardioides sp. YIM 152315]|uniref:N-acetylmuramoyl-L-alanine amidase n=1 Tax=Nocardioides sp. YIM 152315 TaxID=3031760 RepID=UPI0023DBFADA|nr:N-acetylmuramoyl-L-alanine amidase [Nocardioides sp. YIM 152315]MDF1604975.1 N-acetylmuramoyl-L-alanine amidase [Nocardioides sp. YIM 152315]